MEGGNAAGEAAPRPTATRLAWALSFLSVALAPTSVVLAAVNGEGPSELVTDHHAIGILTTLVVAPIGALIVVGDRRHPGGLAVPGGGPVAGPLQLHPAVRAPGPWAHLATALAARWRGGQLADQRTNLAGIVIGVGFLAAGGGLAVAAPVGRRPGPRWSSPWVTTSTRQGRSAGACGARVPLAASVGGT